ncbi:MAG TPA: CopG family antitoxin [Anaerolineae bacterium]|mgnify:CR=1 FL=1|nr:CopG family antitoxin [Anaerolineae bacterium]HQH39240.1 CopG family antitoxin [Anaerolineae bacterium]
MNTKSKRRDPLPEAFESIEAAGDFWDTHDLSDYWDQTSEVHFEVSLGRRVILVPLEQNVAHQLASVARRQGLSTETLVNLWLNERLQQLEVPA